MSLHRSRERIIVDLGVKACEHVHPHRGDVGLEPRLEVALPGPCGGTELDRPEHPTISGLDTGSGAPEFDVLNQRRGQ